VDLNEGKSLSNSYEQPVAAGVAWLDEHVPDWIRVFAWDQAAGLHMADCDDCVLGYVLGSYWDSRSPVYDFGARPPSEVRADVRDAGSQMILANGRLATAAAAPLGFCTPLEVDDEDLREWELLTEAWLDVIGKRLAEAGLLA
jgi:hypothetical protein